MQEVASARATRWRQSDYGRNGVARPGDGARIAYSIRQNGTPPHRLVLIHSLAMDRQFWQPGAILLAERASILAYDCRGHGASDTPPGPYTIELFARDLAHVMDHLG